MADIPVEPEEPLTDNQAENTEGKTEPAWSQDTWNKDQTGSTDAAVAAEQPPADQQAENNEWKTDAAWEDPQKVESNEWKADEAWKGDSQADDSAPDKGAESTQKQDIADTTGADADAAAADETTQEQAWGESSWWKEENTQGDSWTGDQGWDESSWKKDEDAPAEEPEETIVDLNAKSSNTSLEDGGIRVDDTSSFQYRLLHQAIGSASGAWLDVHDIPSKTGRTLPGKIFALGQDAGTPEQRLRAQKYARIALASKSGWVTLDASAESDDGDLTIVKIPDEARDSIVGRSSAALLDVSIQKSVCIFAIDDGNSVPPVRVVQAPEPWLAVGEKVEVLSKGDVRFSKWVPGVVKAIVSQQMVSVRLEKTGAEVVVQWYTNLRPNFDESAPVQAYIESESAPAEESEEGGKSASEWAWTAATFLSWSESGKVNVRKADGTEIEVDAKSVRRPLPPGLDKEDPAEEEAPKAPIRLAIFGAQRGSVEALLSIMANVEWSVPGFFDNHPPPLPPLFDNKDVDDGTWRSSSVEIEGSIKSEQLDQIRKACNEEVIIEIVGSVVRVIGPQAAVKFACALLKLVLVADRSEVTPDQVPDGIDDYLERIPMPGDLVPFVAGKQRNRLNEIEAAENVLVFFLRHPLPEKPAPEEAVADASAEPATADGEGNDAAAENEWDKAENKDWNNKGSSNNDWPAEEEKPKVDILICSIAARGRLRARLPLTRAVESRSPGHVIGSEPQPCICPDDSAAVDILEFAQQDIGWLAGKQGANKKAISAASGCLIEYFLHFGYLAGTGPERARARQYLEWLRLQKPDAGGPGGQREIALPEEALAGRDDVTVMMLTPHEKSAVVKELGDIEQETKTFMVFRHKPDTEFFNAGEQMTIMRGGRWFYIEINEAPAGDDMTFHCKLLPADPGIDEEEASKVPLLIFGCDARHRAAGEQRIRDFLAPKEENAWDEGEDNNNQWDNSKANHWDDNKEEDKNWDRQASNAWESSDDKTNWREKASSSGADAWGGWDKSKADADPWAKADADPWGSKSWDKNAGRAERGDSKRGRNGRGEDAWKSDRSDRNGWEDAKSEKDAWASKSWDKQTSEQDSWPSWNEHCNR